MRKKENRMLDFTPTRKIKGISGLILCGVLLTHTTATSATTLLETKVQLPDPKAAYQNLPETANLSTIDKLIKQNVSPQPSTEKKLDTPNTTSVDNLEKASVANSGLRQGVWGTCPVTLDADGNLTVGAGELSRTFPFNRGNITSITFTGPVVAPVNSSELLRFEKLLSIKGMENLDTTHVTDMSLMFFKNKYLKSLDISQFNTANVTDMGDMFAACQSIKSLDLSNFNTSRVTDMQAMFDSCRDLTSLDISNFDTSKVTNMKLMFYLCNNLKTLDLSHFNTTNVTTMRAMFYSSSITTLNLSNFDLTSIKDDYESSSMFERLYHLSKLTLGTKIRLQSNMALPNSNNSLRWRDIGQGTEESPQGKNIWTANELLDNYDPEKHSGTYILTNNPLIAKKLTINYVDEAGKQLLDSKIQTGLVGDPVNYITYRERIAGYSLKEVKGNTNKLTDEEQTLTFVYSKNEVKATLTINYVDETGNQILSPKTYEGVVGDRINLETYEISIDGYSFKKTTNVITELTDKKQTVTLVYSKDKVKSFLTINYVDEAGNQLLDPKIYTGVVGEQVNLEAYKINIDGYSFKQTTNAITKLTDKEQTVTLIYSKNKVKATLTINYVDEAGKQLLEPKTYNGLVGGQVNLETYKISIDGYTFKGFENKITELTNTEQTVTLIYSKNKAKATLTIKYVDEAGKQLLDPKTYNGLVGDPVNLETYKISIDGYSFKSVENKITELTNTEQTVTLIYSKNKVKATLTINYVDEAGNQILDPKIYNGVIGEQIDLEAYKINIDGYSFKQTTNAITKLTDKEQTVTLIYSKNKVKASLTINYVDEAGNQILAPKTYEGVVGEKVNLKTYEKKIDEYSFKKTTNAITELTDKKQTVTLIYSKNKVKASLTINYVDEAGNQILDPKTYEGVVGERVNLETYEKKIDGYSFQKTTNAITKLTDKEQTVTLIYSKNKVKATLTINYVDEAGNQILDPKTYEGVVGERVNLETYKMTINGYSFKGFENKITELTDAEQTITLIYTVAMSDAPSDDDSDKTQNKLPEEANVDTSKPKKRPLKLVKLLPKTGESRSNGLIEGVSLTALVASLFMLLRRRRH